MTLLTKSKKQLLNRGVFFVITLFLEITVFISPVLAQSAEPNLATAVEDVANRIGPTVVSIATEKTEHYRINGNPFYGSPFQDEFFQKFFEDFFGEIPEKQFKRSGLGSGVIIDKDGFILTNEHVVAGADKISVTLSDGRQFKGVLKGTDPRSDLAVIKIDAPNLPVAALGDSDKLKIGQWVIAIGNPFGHILSNPEPTVTTGVVSAMNRSLHRTSRTDSDYSDLIQTDAAINPGNSCGPLVNLNGDIVGINVAIFSTSGGYQGIGFAIPVNNAKRIVQQLIAGKKIAYGWIGVSIQNLDERLAKYFGLPTTDGVLVVKVLSQGPAEKAGIQDGDIILAADGKKITNMNTLLKHVGNAAVGKPVTLTIFRDNKKIEIDITIQQRPSFDEQGEKILEDEAGETDISDSQQLKEWRGIEVKDITPILAQQLRLPQTEGVIIANLKPESPAESGGLQQGDIIIEVNKRPIKGTNDFLKATKSAKGNCLVRVLRGYFVIEEK